jgi:type IV pilus assembly protein PilV
MKENFALRQQRGLTLLEVLIAVVVLAIGLLAVAAMQAGSLANSHGSHHHSLATTLAADALDRLRTGQSVAEVNSYYQSQNNRYSAQFPGTVTIAVAASGGQVTVTVRWQDERLPDGDGQSQNQVVVRSRV